MMLSPNISLEELIATTTGLPNEPHTNAARDKLLYLANYLLQPIRDRWGALTISSGFRSLPVNTAVGGSSSSQHCYGEAADFVPYAAGIDDVYRWIVIESGLKFGQCIKEEKKKGETIKKWIHLSLIRLGKDNQQALVCVGKNYRPYA